MSDVVFVQDHLVQHGGAERVLLAMLDAAPGAEIVTAFYAPDQCYDEYRTQRIRTLPLDRIAALRNHHRVALPLLPFAFSATRIDAPVVFCCTSGWAQGVRATGRKVVYFQALARWLYERDTYLRGAGPVRRAATTLLHRPLERWDRRTVATGHRFLTQSSAMQARLRELYGVDAEILPPPNLLDPAGPTEPFDDLEPGYFLCPARLMPYKHVDVLVDAFASLPGRRLVVAGDGPLLDQLRNRPHPNVTFVGHCNDAQLRWLYRNCTATITAAAEPFGLAPVEAAAFGRPTIALAAGGFLDTVIDGVTGLRFDAPTPAKVAEAVTRFDSAAFDDDALRKHARQYDRAAFVSRIKAIIDEERAR